MHKLTIDVGEIKKIDINGEIFDILKSDKDVFLELHAMEKKVQEMSVDPDSDEAIDAMVEIMHFLQESLDSILGEGAWEKISKGVPIGIGKAISVYTQIVEGIKTIYMEDVDEKYL